MKEAMLKGLLRDEIEKKLVYRIESRSIAKSEMFKCEYVQELILEWTLRKGSLPLGFPKEDIIKSRFIVLEQDTIDAMVDEIYATQRRHMASKFANTIIKQLAEESA